MTSLVGLIVGYSPQVLSLWIPLFDVDEQTGCLHLVPASHRRGLVPIAMGGGAIRRRLVTVH